MKILGKRTAGKNPRVVPAMLRPVLALATFPTWRRAKGEEDSRQFYFTEYYVRLRRHLALVSVQFYRYCTSFDRYVASRT